MPPNRNGHLKNTLLQPGDRLILTLFGNCTAHSHVKTVTSEGCLQVTYAGQKRPGRGDEVKVQSDAGDSRKIYYMQVKDEGASSHPYMVLQRNPGWSLNKRRRGWRIPYTATTAIRNQSDHHFRSATFCDLSMTSARIASEFPFPPESFIVLRLMLPNFPEHDISGRVIRTSTTPICKDFFGQDQYGLVIVFESMSRLAVRHLTYFLWNHIRSTYPRQMQLLYDIGHKRQYGD